jgi:hypothetical protein
MKTKGVLVYWNPAKKFGIVECREASNGGWKLTKFFLHQARINFIMGEPHIDCFVRFEVGKTPPKQLTSDGRRPALPEAYEAEVYQTREQAEKVEPKVGA